MLIQKHHSKKVVPHETSSPCRPHSLDASTLLTSTRILLFALSAGVLVASLYYVQPLTSMLAASFGVSVPQAGYLVTATQIGYVLGIVFLVPSVTC
jgi:predicted MFS family arabinose efflux permease